MPSVRLQRYLAQHHLGSRRACEDLVRVGRVTVNGEVASLGSLVGLGDEVRLDGRALGPAGGFRYLMLHKPPGLVVSKRDERGRPTVLSILPSGIARAVFPVGRLDLESEGLLLLTDDGELANRLLHPSFEVPRTYLAWVSGEPGDRQFERMRSGLELEPGVKARAEAATLRRWRGGALLSLTLREGRKREVRRMCASLGLRVARLKRVSFGPLRLGDLPAGQYRALTRAELSALRRAVAPAAPGDVQGGGAAAGRRPGHPSGG